MEKLLASPKLSIPKLYRRKKRILKIPLLIFFIFNTIYITTYYTFYQSSHKSNLILNIPIDDSNELPQTSTTNTNYTNELTYLLQNLKQPQLSAEFDTSQIPMTNPDILFHDPRYTFGRLLNSVNNHTKSIPFHWADWIDLTYLNNQIAKPQDRKIKCQDLISQMNMIRKSDRDKASKDTKFFGCLNVDELTQEQIDEIGLNKEQLPGFVQFEHTMFTSTDYVRNLQGKSYVLTSMPLPFKVIFLNDKGDDLVFDVHNMRLAKSLNDQTILNPTEKFNEIVDNNTYTYQPKPTIEMSFDLFNYTRRDVIKKINQLKKISSPSIQESTYLNSLISTLKVRPADNPEHRYFHESTLKLNRDNHDNGWHYDWRFFNGRLGDNHERTSIILERLLRNWFKFSEKYGMISWIAHGPLLSWYWNGGIFPFDNDLDIQMPMKHLAKLGELYNQTIIVEDLNEGFGKYLIEVGTFIHNRNISKRGNHIDARFIDVDTGIYIDITGLSTSGSFPPIQYFKNINDDVDEGPFLIKKSLPTVNDRRQHFYNLNHLSPLKLSMLNGVPCYLPNSIVKRLKYEYPNGALTKIEYNGWYFVNKLSSWIHESVLKNYLDLNYITKSNGAIDKDLIKAEINQMTDEQIYKLLIDNKQVLTDYYLSLEYNDFHNEELKWLFTIDETKNKNINDLASGKIIDTDISSNNDYSSFIVENVKLHKPVRESLFQFEKIGNGLKSYYETASKELDYIAIS